MPWAEHSCLTPVIRVGQGGELWKPGEVNVQSSGQFTSLLQHHQAGNMCVSMAWYCGSCPIAAPLWEPEQPVCSPSHPSGL